MSQPTDKEPTDKQIRTHFDELGHDEWHRLEASPSAKVSLAIHQRFLARFVQPGDRVLEIGAGPGRFTCELARAGATVVVTEFSQVQLQLNREYVAANGCEHAVEDRRLLDVRDAGNLAAHSFDLVVAFGGPLSYVFDDASDALAGLLNVVKPDRAVVASVMGTLGTWRALLDAVEEEAELHGDATMDQVFLSGDLRPIQPTGHVCQMYRASELTDLVQRAGGRVVAASASNWASLGNDEVLAAMVDKPQRWALFVDQEANAAAEWGALDGGTHLLFAAVAA